jgi:hypothetical protein
VAADGLEGPSAWAFGVGTTRIGPCLQLTPAPLALLCAGPWHMGARLLEQDVRRNAQPPMQAPAHRQGERALAGEHGRRMAAEICFEVL